MPPSSRRISPAGTPGRRASSRLSPARPLKAVHRAGHPEQVPGTGRAKLSGRRLEIIERAAPILMEEGFEGVSMNEIARRLDMSKPGVYYHFKSKNELLYAIMQHTMDWTEKMALEVMVRTHDNHERLRQILYQHALAVAASATEGVLTTLVVDEVNALRPEDRRVITQRKRSYFELVRSTIAQLQNEGKLRPGLDPTVATFTTLGMAMWVTKWYRASGRLPAEAVASQIVTMALAAVLLPAG